MTVIAMTREMGSLGKEVARLAADRLGLTIVHHEMIASAADRPAASDTSAVARFLEVGPDFGYHVYDPEMCSINIWCIARS